jgi:DNA-binding NtrC family response regulator
VSSPGTSRSFRWQALFEQVREPLFVLDRRRRILFANRAWEEFTGVSLAEAHGLACTRRGSATPERRERVARVLWPPPEVIEGKPAQVRRQVSDLMLNGPPWWDILFFPLQGEPNGTFILGKIHGAPIAAAAGFVPLPEALRELHSRLSQKLPREEIEQFWRPEKLVGLRERLAQQYRLDLLDAALPAMQRVAEQVRLASQIRACVLLVGEPGSGKHWLARAIHQASPAQERSFVALDCARLPSTVVAELLFGSGRLCARPGIGTICLKEPARLSVQLQERLLDWLRESSASADRTAPRVLAGASPDPFAEVRAGRLLEALYATLATMEIVLPPLRDRLADLPSLTDRMLERLNSESERRILGLTDAAWEVFREYRWPGNLRELHAVLAGCHQRAAAERIDVTDLPATLRQAVRLDREPTPLPDQPLSLDSLLEQTERRLIEVALRRARGNKSRAAELLSVWRPRLLRRMEALGIKETGERG